MIMSNIQDLQQYIDSSKRIVFFGGAGVSTASGIPDFRSSKGLFLQETGHNASAEEIVSNQFFTRYPKIFFEFYFKNLVYEDAKPNLVHQYIAELEKTDKDISVVTQNIDGLHEKAGSTKIFNLHGNVYSNHCMVCGERFSLKELQLDDDGIPRCPNDQGIVRPDITLYGEQLDMTVLEGAINEIARADLLVILGTSLAVYPAAGLVDYFNGDQVAVINKTTIRSNNPNSLFIQGDMNQVFEQLN